MKLKKLVAVCGAVIMAASVIFSAGFAMAEEAEPEAPEGAIVVDAATPVEVTGGMITGTTNEDGTIAIYKGIPYAQPPVGDLRWVAPMDPEPWEGVRACDKFGNIAWQNWPDWDRPYMVVFSPEFFDSEDVVDRSEDCLYLNVWTKQGVVEEKRPVIVYMHGGGFGEGSGSIPVYDGTHLAEDGIVYVSINYRLGIQGFLTTEELDAESPYGTSGNYAIIDCVKTLEWVKANIEKFGGDPDNVTIAGQSAGGSAVNALIGTHIAAGLFNNAAVFSGGFVRPGRSGFGGLTKADAQAAFKEAYPDATLEQLREVPIDELFENYSLRGNIVIDNAVIASSNLEGRIAGDFNPINLMIGYVDGDANLPGVFNATTVDEYNTWVDENYGEDAELMKELYPVTTDEEAMAQSTQISFDSMIMGAWGEALVETAETGKDAFIYFINHQAPAAVEVGMPHTGDIPYWLGGTLRERKQYETEIDLAMYDVMKGYFENFIATGDPNGEGLPQWDKFDGSYKYMRIGDGTFDMVEIPKEVGDFWLNRLDSANEGVFSQVLEKLNAQ